MTSSPTPAVLPDARAREALRRWHRDSCYPDAGAYELEIGLAAIKSALSPPASDAAVPAGFVLVPVELTDEQRDAAIAVDIDSVTEYPFRLSADEARAVYRAMIAAAPKVASDTGAGLRGALERISVIAASLRGSSGVLADGSDYGAEDRQRWAAVRNGTANIMRLAALAADATDSRAWKPHLDYAGEPMREGEFRDPTDATDGATGGGDLLEQAARAEDDEFNRGVLIAVSTLINAWGESTQTEYLLRMINANAAMVERMDFTDYDRDPLLAALKETSHG